MAEYHVGCGLFGNKKLKVTFEIFASKEENNDPHMDT